MLKKIASFHPIKITKSSTEIINQILSLINNKQLRPGEKLPSEMELTKLLETSRPTIREALSALKALGLVISTSGRGTFISEDKSFHNSLNRLSLDIKTQQDFLEALEARLAIECQICWLASKRAKKEDMKRLYSALESMNKANTAEAFRKADYNFHLSLAHSSKNSLFVKFMEDVYKTLTVYYWQILEKAGRTNESISKIDHKKIYEAVAKRNQKLSREMMRKHLNKIRVNFLSSFSNI